MDDHALLTTHSVVVKAEPDLPISQAAYSARTNVNYCEIGPRRYVASGLNAKRRVAPV